MDAAYAQRYRDLYSRHWWWRAREHLILSTLRSIAPPEGFRSILDVGCGDGLFFDRLHEFGDVEGVEPDATLVDPRSRWASRIRIQPFDETFGPGRRYSLITMLDVLEHLPDAAAALRLAATLLEPHGVLVATVPAFPVLWTSHDDVNHHVQRFTRQTLTRLIGEAGLETMSTRYFFFWICPIKLMIGFKERVLHRPSAMEDVPAPLVNRALYALSLLEEASLGRLSMPFGSSLLFVGRPVDRR
jgi:SAM-dependent methyltransferase